MRAVVFETYGPPEVLRVVETDAPSPGRGQVRVRVRTAGVQPADAKIRSGAFDKWMQVRFPQIPGNEFAGVVDALGAGVTGFTEGDEVIGVNVLSSYAEFVVVDATQLVAKPTGLAWAEAGALSASGQTAYTALKELGVSRGETLLVHAAAGGVGSMAVQVARAWGVTVIGTASEKNHAYLRELGAIPVAYGDGLVERVHALSPRGVDAVLDGIGGDALDASIALGADRTRIGTIADPVRANALGLRRIQSKRSAGQLAELTAMAARGDLRVHVQRVYSLDEATEAHRAIEAGHVRGKIVLSIT